MTKTPDQEAHTIATSPAGPIPWQAPFPTHTAGHTVNTGEQNALGQQTDDEDAGNITLGPASGDPSAEVPARARNRRKSRSSVVLSVKAAGRRSSPSVMR